MLLFFLLVTVALYFSFSVFLYLYRMKTLYNISLKENIENYCTDSAACMVLSVCKIILRPTWRPTRREGSVGTGPRGDLPGERVQLVSDHVETYQERGFSWHRTTWRPTRREGSVGIGPFIRPNDYDTADQYSCFLFHFI